MTWDGTKSLGFPMPQTTSAAASARSMEKMGPAAATMILSIGLMGGSASAPSLRPSMDSMGAICGRETKPPAGIQPSPYWAPLLVVFQVGFSQQTLNGVVVVPRDLSGG